jgi:ABC-type glycerol-3-phosphate transport system permease component
VGPSHEPRLRRRLSTWGALRLLVFLVLAIGPIAWGIVTSLMPTSALTQSPPDLSLENLTLDNYRDVLITRGNLPDALFDSAVVATLTAVFPRLSPRRPGDLRAGRRSATLARMFPGIVIAIPLFIVFATAPRGHLHALHDLPLTTLVVVI